MTFQQLQYLLEVSRTGSISGAAKNLFLAQSSVSASISNLEKELGFSVFIRNKKGVIPTVQGAEVIEQAARICESYRVMTKADSTACRRIRVSAPAYAPLDSAFVRLIQIYSQNDAVCFSADTLNTADAIRKLTAFELDAAVLLNHDARVLAVQTLAENKGLQWRTLAAVPVVVQLGPGHRLYRQSEIRLADLEKDLFVDDLQDALIQNDFLKGVIRLSPENTVSVKSAHARNLLLAQGLAYSIGAGVPQDVADRYQLRSIPLSDVNYTLTVVTNPLSRPAPEIDTYISLIEQELQTK